MARSSAASVRQRCSRIKCPTLRSSVIRRRQVLWTSAARHSLSARVRSDRSETELQDHGPHSDGASRRIRSLEGERKTVTALFADIKGSTELMEDLDPEEARAIVDPRSS